MSRVIIIGGHGKIALLLTPLLTEQGDEVTSVIRKADQAADVRAAGAVPLVADVGELDAEETADMLRGFDAVVWSAGAGGGDADRTYAVDRDAAIRVADAAERAGVGRLVIVSYFGAGTDHGVDPSDSFFPYAEAKAAADEHIRGSRLDWTILGPSMLTLEPASGAIDTDASEAGSVSRANVARTIRAVLADDTTIRRTIRFNDGDTPVEEAVHADA